MAAANRTWGEERIAAELRLKLGLTVSPRTVRRYMPRHPRRRGGHQPTQSWTTFLHNHAGAVLACDFFLVVTATFHRLYVFVLIDITTRRVVHWNVTAHPTAGWTLQQFRNALPHEPGYRFLVHDRDSLFAPAVDEALGSMSLKVPRTPARAPQATDRARLTRSIRRASGLVQTPQGLPIRCTNRQSDSFLSSSPLREAVNSAGPGTPGESDPQPLPCMVTS